MTKRNINRVRRRYRVRYRDQKSTVYYGREIVEEISQARVLRDRYLKSGWDEAWIETCQTTLWRKTS